MVEDAPGYVAGDLHRYLFGILHSDRIADRGTTKATRNSTIEVDYSASPVPRLVKTQYLPSPPRLKTWGRIHPTS
jgi:hypothetical protein